jgi:hypothetical protein
MLEFDFVELVLLHAKMKRTAMIPEAAVSQELIVFIFV